MLFTIPAAVCALLAANPQPLIELQQNIGKEGSVTVLKDCNQPIQLAASTKVLVIYRIEDPLCVPSRQVHCINTVLYHATVAIDGTVTQVAKGAH